MTPKQLHAAVYAVVRSAWAYDRVNDPIYWGHRRASAWPAWRQERARDYWAREYTRVVGAALEALKAHQLYSDFIAESEARPLLVRAQIEQASGCVSCETAQRLTPAFGRLAHRLEVAAYGEFGMLRDRDFRASNMLMGRFRGGLSRSAGR